MFLLYFLDCAGNIIDGRYQDDIDSGIVMEDGSTLKNCYIIGFDDGKDISK